MNAPEQLQLPLSSRLIKLEKDISPRLVSHLEDSSEIHLYTTNGQFAFTCIHLHPFAFICIHLTLSSRFRSHDNDCGAGLLVIRSFAANLLGELRAHLPPSCSNSLLLPREATHNTWKQENPCLHTYLILSLINRQSTIIILLPIPSSTHPSHPIARTTHHCISGIDNSSYKSGTAGHKFHRR